MLLKVKDTLVGIIMGMAISLLIWFILPNPKHIETHTLIRVDSVYKPLWKVEHSKPVNTPITPRGTKKVTAHSVPEDSIKTPHPTYSAIDTLRFDSIYVAIRDTGDCYGIINRASTWGGKLKEVMITKTVTNTITKPSPRLTLFGGIQANLKNKDLYEVAPTLSLDIKNNFLLGYGYGINHRTQNISILFKIK